MKTQTYAHNPEIRVFFKLFAFHTAAMLLVVVLMYLIFAFGAPVFDYLKSVGLIIFLFPMMNSIIGVYSLRKHTFTITDAAVTTDVVASWVVELLQKNDMRIKARHQNQTILEPTGSFLKWFGNRFGTGLATITYTESEVTLAGPFKYADIVNSRIKFGRIDFQIQPYNHL